MDVRIEGLRFERTRRVVLDVPTLVIRRDRTTVILGPNGAGKTTLLRLIAGLECSTAGRVVIGGIEVVPGRRHDVAYVFQELVFLRQSVRANLELGLTLRSVPDDEREKRIVAAARLVGIEPLLGRRADQLSGGEGKRVSIARALCLQSPLVLLDEPLSGLDPGTYTRLLDELPSLLHAFGATSVVVTHSHTEAIRLAEDIVVIVEGGVRAAGEKREILLNPREATVAGLLGYTVIRTSAGPVAVQATALKPGAGRIEFSLDVEEVVHLIDGRQVIGRIGESRVEIPLPPGAPASKRGERLVVHADRVADVEDR